MATTNIQVRVDSSLKTEAEQLFCDLGLDMPTAIRLFLRQSLIANGLPFALERDKFYSTNNQQVLKQSIEQMKSGKIVRKSLDDLEGLVNEL